MPRTLAKAAIVGISGVAMAVGVFSPVAEANTPTVNIKIQYTCHLAAVGGGGGGCYMPAQASAAKGQTVVWTNTTVFTHTVTRCRRAPGACPVSGGTGTDTRFKTSPLIHGPGGVFRFAFNGSGTYVYYCTVHGYAIMHATVVVH
jgi:plastocyanin